jgi:hypothetical protein
MRTTLKVFSIISIVLGSITIIAATGETSLSEAMYALIGGGLFLSQGILSLVYIKQTPKTN